MSFTKTLLAAAALLALGASAGAAQASVQVFTDRTAFEAAISGSQTFGFGGLAPDNSFKVTDSATVGPATFSTATGLPDVFSYGVDSTSNHYSTASLSGQGLGGARATLNMAISGASTAVGFDVGSYSMFNAASNIFINGVDITQIVTPGVIGATEFIGFLSSDSISAVSFKNVAAPTIDLTDFTVGSTLVAGVPEPTEWALLVLGAGMAGGALRASRKRAATA